ncbi:hypothetical protein ACFOHU_08015 [Ottowia pentelensis]|uniref:Uncharacterized protein n=1 Tax=Ottowia pentelensis TaxID=511108 RepID=A0ABV6PTJ1_9BURK
MSGAAPRIAAALLCAALAPAQASGWPVSLDDVWRALTGRKQTIDWERLDPRPLPASAPAPAASAPASAPVKGPRHD